MALGVSGDLARYIVKEGMSICRRAVWFCLVHPVWGRIGFVGAYGPNSSQERTALWWALFFELDPTFRWALFGDFNMIESPTDQLGCAGGCVAGREGGAWAQLVRKFKFKDTFAPKRGHLSYSWDNLRVHRHNPLNSSHPLGNRMLRRLDRMYLSLGNAGADITGTSTIIPGIAFSDRAPIWATLSLDNAPSRPSCHRMNASHFNHPEFKERISRMWEAEVNRGLVAGRSPDLTLKKCLQSAQKIDRCWGKRRALERRQRLQTLQYNLTSAQLLLERAPADPILQAGVSTAWEALTHFNSAKARWVDTVIQARWMETGIVDLNSSIKHSEAWQPQRTFPSCLTIKVTFCHRGMPWLTRLPISSKAFSGRYRGEVYQVEIGTRSVKFYTTKLTGSRWKRKRF